MNQITFQTAKGLAVRFCGLGLMYLSTVLAANYLGAGQFGIYTSALSLSPIWAVLAVGGIDVLATKTIATASKGNPAETAGHVSVICAVGCFGIILGLLFVGLLFLVSFELGMGGNSSLFLYSMLIFPAMLIANLRQTIALPLIGVAGAMIPEQIILPAMFSLSILALAKFGTHADTHLVFVFYFLASLAAWLCGMRLIWSKGGFARALRQRITFEQVFDRLRQGRPFYLSAVASTVMNNAVTVLVSFVLGFKDAGLFFVASRLSGLAYIPLGVIDQAVMPAAARLHNDNDRAGLFHLAKFTSGLGFLAGITISIGIAIFHRPLLGLFSHEYESQGNVVLILLVGQTVNTFFGPNAAFMKMTGLERLYSRLLLAMAIILPVAVPVSAALGGVQLVAICMSIVLVAWNMVLCRYLWLKRKLVVLPYGPTDMLAQLKEALGVRRSWKFWISS